MHYKVFDGMPWASIIGDANFCFVISQKVFDEIDKHKDSSNIRRKKRARSINRILLKYLDGEKIKNLELKFCPNPSRKATERDDFDNSSSDEFIVFSAFEFKIGENDSKLIISHDGGMKLRASKVGIKVIIPEDKFQLSEEPTEEEIELKKTKKELELYKNRASLPEILFGDQTEVLYIEHVELPLIDDEVSEYRTELIDKFPHKDFVHPSPLYGAGVFDSPNPQVFKYNSAIDSYIEKMCDIYSNRLMDKYLESAIKPISFVVANSGTARTGNLVMTLCFPEELTLFTDESRSEFDYTPPTPPEIGSKLRASFDDGIKYKASINYAINRALYGIMSETTPRDSVVEEHWDLEKTVKNKEEIFINASPLSQNLVFNLNKDTQFFVLASHPGTYEIKWTIFDDSHPKPFDGVLKLIID